MPNFLRKMSNLLRKMARSLKKQFDTLLWRIAYKKLMERYRDDEVKIFLLDWLRTHSLVIFVCYWMVPGIFLLLCYLGTYGCGISPTRPYMEACGVCLRLESRSQSSSPWYLELWDNQASITEYSETPSLYIRTIMLSHLPMYDAQIALQYQSVKLQGSFLSEMEEEKLVNSIDQSTMIISSLAFQLHNFAFTLCMEKDLMAAALRTFVDAYSKTTTMSNTTTVSLVSFVLWPWGHPLRFFNRQWLSPLFPEPRLYTFEVGAEMRFQKQRLADSYNEALDRINVSSPTFQDPKESISQVQLLELAIKTVTTQLEQLKHMIHESKSFRWPWSSMSQEISIFQELYEFLALTHVHMLTVLKIAKAYQIMSTRLWNDLQPLRSTLSSSPRWRISYSDLLAVRDSLRAQVQNVLFVPLGQSSRVKEGGDVSNNTDVPPNASLFGYNLDDIDDTQLSTGRSAIAELCKAGDIGDILDDDLHTICIIYTLAATMSGLDKEALSSQRRSWLVELETATEEFDKQSGVDIYGLRDRLKKLVGETEEDGDWLRQSKIDAPSE